GDLGAGATRTVVLRHEGDHVLTAAVTDSDGATGTASDTFTVNPTPPVVTIIVPAEGTRVFQDTPLVLTGMATDATDGVLSNALHCTSSLDGDRPGAPRGPPDAHGHGHRPRRRRRQRQHPRHREPLGAGLRPRGRYLCGCRDAHQALRHRPRTAGRQLSRAPGLPALPGDGR